MKKTIVLTSLLVFSNVTAAQAADFSVKTQFVTLDGDGQVRNTLNRSFADSAGCFKDFWKSTNEVQQLLASTAQTAEFNASSIRINNYSSASAQLGEMNLRLVQVNLKSISRRSMLAAIELENCLKKVD